MKKLADNIGLTAALFALGSTLIGGAVWIHDLRADVDSLKKERAVKLAEMRCFTYLLRRQNPTLIVTSIDEINDKPEP